MDKLLVHLHLLFEVKFITWPIGTAQANWWMKMVLRSSLIDFFFVPLQCFTFLMTVVLENSVPTSMVVGKQELLFSSVSHKMRCGAKLN